jgi:hypothetical protein
MPARGSTDAGKRICRLTPTIFDVVIIHFGIDMISAMVFIATGTMAVIKNGIR